MKIHERKGGANIDMMDMEGDDGVGEWEVNMTKVSFIYINFHNKSHYFVQLIFTKSQLFFVTLRTEEKYFLMYLPFLSLFLL